LNSAGLIVVCVLRAKLIPGSFGLASRPGTKYLHWIWWPAGLGTLQRVVDVHDVVPAPFGPGRGAPPDRSPVWKWPTSKIETLSSMTG
jgi:hypothetical protein